MKKVISLLLTSLFFLSFAFAETVIFKSGKEIAGEKIEQTDEYIKIDFYGIPMTCYFDEIESIDGKKITNSSPPKSAITYEAKSTYSPEQVDETHKTGVALDQSQTESTYESDSASSQLQTEPTYGYEPEEGPTPQYAGGEDMDQIIPKLNSEIPTAELVVPVIIMIIQAIIGILVVASCWIIFTKAGEPGWGSIVPIYNIYILLKISGRPGWWLLLFFIPLAGFIASILVYMDIAKNFGKSTGFGIGMAFLPFIFLPMLAFSDAQFQATTSA